MSTTAPTITPIVYADGTMHTAGPIYSYALTVPGTDRYGNGARLLTRRQVLRAVRKAGYALPRGTKITLRGESFADREV